MDRVGCLQLTAKKLIELPVLHRKVRYHINHYNELFKVDSPNQQRYEYAYVKWLEYYYHSEIYDRRVCSGYDEKNQCAMPLNTVEYLDINRNAKRLMNNVIRELRDKEIEEDIWRSARSEASRHSHNKVEELLKHYTS